MRPDAPSPTPLTVDGSEHYLALTLPSQEHPSYRAALELVRRPGFVLEPSNRKWWLRDRHKTLNLLAELGTRLREEFHAVFTPNFQKNTANLRSVEVVSSVQERSGGDYDVTIGLKAGPADEAQIRSALAASRDYLEVGGQIFLLDPVQIRRVAEAQRALSGDPRAALTVRRSQRVAASSAPELDELLSELSPSFKPPAAWAAQAAPLRELMKLAPAPVPAALDDRLRTYQRIGVAWLWFLRQQKLGGILADEMGLGKTVQALALLASVHREPAGTSLVVCPASLLENWRREAAQFAPQLGTFVHHGTSRLEGPAAFLGVELIITSYGTLARDQALFGGFEFACVIADEAQHIKNRRSQNARSLASLRASSRFLLTGTPLENSLDDLRSLFEVLLPGYLPAIPSGTRGEDKGWFDERLKAQTAPFILRRTKRAVAPELPPRIEQVLWCELSPKQSALYHQAQQAGERELLDLEAGGAPEGKLRFAALTQLLRLRQICCDPRLAPGRSEELTPGDSSKLEVFLELVDEAVDDGHRLLVFSQFTSLLALLRPELEKLGLSHCYLDGSMPASARQAEVDRFQRSADIPIFLLSLKAGGTGLNLTAADTVVHFDPWWNPAVEAQATDRAHRIGQSRTVTSYKMIVSGTVEEKVLGLQDDKRRLLAGVFEASDAVAAKLSLIDLKGLLRP